MQKLDHRQWAPGTWATYQLWCYEKDELCNPHTHTFYELFWIESGSGRQWLNGKVETLEAGDLVLVRPEDTHCFAAAKNGEFLEFVNVAFVPRVWQELRQRYFARQPAYFSLRPTQARRHHLEPAQICRLDVLAASLRRGARDRLAIEAFLTGLLALLEEPTASPEATRVPDWLSLAAEQIRFYPNFCGGAATLARLAKRSPEHVARECRRFFDKRPNDLVNEARLDYASRELRSGQKPILDIALNCGIENLGHFYQLFRRHHGLTPAQYRKQFGASVI